MVLDAERFPEIRFQSTTVEAKGANHWVVNGKLGLHGQTHPVTVDVTLKDGFQLAVSIKRDGPRNP
jgi:polyisoprenoid-binding protein YceI